MYSKHIMFCTCMYWSTKRVMMILCYNKIRTEYMYDIQHIKMGDILIVFFIFQRKVMFK